VHLVHRVHGFTVPRDASDQHERATPVQDTDTTAPGGLYFFARPGQRAFHVGFMAGGGNGRAMLHAPRTVPGDGGRIEEAPMAPHAPRLSWVQDRSCPAEAQRRPILREQYGQAPPALVAANPLGDLDLLGLGGPVALRAKRRPPYPDQVEGEICRPP
jgi:hypothetical protein